ncbi:hypothetical protein Ancab_001180 [Ancistrocladus abbreviatus]
MSNPHAGATGSLLSTILSAQIKVLPKSKIPPIKTEMLSSDELFPHSSFYQGFADSFMNKSPYLALPSVVTIHLCIHILIS